MKVTGKLERSRLEGGSWQVRARDATWTLLGDVPPALAGREVVVEGDEEGGMGIHMAGPMLRVRSVRESR